MVNETPTMIGGTDTSLTHVNNRWVFRARPNDSYSSRVIAEFGINTLKLRKWAIVHSTDANDVTKGFTRKYKDKYGINPDTFASWAHDSIYILAMAFKSAGSTDPEAIRKAILSIKGYQGVEGGYQFDENGDGLHGYNVVRNDGGKIVFMKHVEFPPQ